MEYEGLSLEGLAHVAQDLARTLSFPFTLALWGDLGAGKTTFCQFFLKELLKDPTASIPSPTFTLINVYETPKGDLWHCDLYRLSREEQVLDLGLFEGENVSYLIEWPERLGAYLPENRIDLRFAIEEEGRRSLEFYSSR